MLADESLAMSQHGCADRQIPWLRSSTPVLLLSLLFQFNGSIQFVEWYLRWLNSSYLPKDQVCGVVWLSCNQCHRFQWEQRAYDWFWCAACEHNPHKVYWKGLGVACALSSQLPCDADSTIICWYRKSVSTVNSYQYHNRIHDVCHDSSQPCDVLPTESRNVILAVSFSPR